MIMCHALLMPAVSKLRASGPRALEVSISIDLDSRAYFSFLASAAVHGYNSSFRCGIRYVHV